MAHHFLDESTKICGMFESKADAKRCFWREIHEEIDPICGFYGIPQMLLARLEASTHPRFQKTFGVADVSCGEDEFVFQGEAHTAHFVKSLVAAHFKIITSGLTPPAPVCHNVACTEVAVAKCSYCLTATYCSNGCQAVHWPTHKSVCRKPSGTIEC